MQDNLSQIRLEQQAREYELKVKEWEAGAKRVDSRKKKEVEFLMKIIEDGNLDIPKNTIQYIDQDAVDKIMQGKSGMRYESAIIGLPQDLMATPCREFVEQLCNELFKIRAGFVEARKNEQEPDIKPIISAVPSCVVSRNVFNYMVMALNPFFPYGVKIGDYDMVGQKRPVYSQVGTGDSAPRVTDIHNDPKKIQETNNSLFLIANNLLSRREFIRDNVVYSSMRVICAQGMANFGVDPAFEDWQARACFDDGSNPELTVGITDNRLYR